jgi:hypothetical protein
VLSLLLTSCYPYVRLLPPTKEHARKPEGNTDARTIPAAGVETYAGLEGHLRTVRKGGTAYRRDKR